MIAVTASDRGHRLGITHTHRGCPLLIGCRCTFQFLGGCQGRRTGVGVTTVSNSLILGGWVTKVLNNGEKTGRVEGWVTTIFRLFRPTVPE